MASKYTREIVTEAIADSYGIMSQIARRLGCAWSTAQRQVERWGETREAYQNERERILDLAESITVDKLKSGDFDAARWVLSRLGRDRGYGPDRPDVTAEAERGEMVVKVSVRDPDERYTYSEPKGGTNHEYED